MRRLSGILCLVSGLNLLLGGLAAGEEIGSAARALDFDPNNVKVTLHMKNYKSSRIILGQEDSVQNYDRTWGLKVLIHGLSESDESGWMVAARDAFLSKHFNVITVDWETYSGTWDFAKAVNYTVPVGEHVAAIIKWMNKLFYMENDEHHVIGFSLGSHIAGIIGYNLQNPKLARISGLDVPSPTFLHKPLELRLDKTDAQFVDIIHTNGGTLFDGGLGWTTSLGHVDFYPNGGRRQPGCAAYFFSLVYKNFIFYDGSNACNHGRAVKLYLESIDNKDAFQSLACTKDSDYQQGKCLDGKSFNRMGFYATATLDTEFYLSTRDESPYTADEVFVNITISDAQDDTAGTITLSLEGDGLTEERKLLDNKSIRRGEVFNRVIGVSPDMRSITKVIMTFDKRITSTNGRLNVDSMNILNTKLNQRYCLKNFDVENAKPEILTPTKC